MTIDRALTAADVASMVRGRRSGAGWAAKCPAHQDPSPSLSIDEGEAGRVLLHCFAGCTAEEIAQALGVRMGDLMGSAPRRDGERRALLPIRSLTPEQELLGNEILLQLWMCAVEVRVSPDHLRLVITPRMRVPAELLGRVRKHELLVIHALEAIDGVSIYSLPVTRRRKSRQADAARARLREII